MITTALGGIGQVDLLAGRVGGGSFQLDVGADLMRPADFSVFMSYIHKAAGRADDKGPAPAKLTPVISDRLP
jgi:hypothetical protein